MIEWRLKSEVDEDLAFLLDGYCTGCLIKLIGILQKGVPMDVEHMTDLCIEMMPQPVKEILTEGFYPADILTE